MLVMGQSSGDLFSFVKSSRLFFFFNLTYFAYSSFSELKELPCLRGNFIVNVQRHQFF